MADKSKFEWTDATTLRRRMRKPLRSVNSRTPTRANFEPKPVQNFNQWGRGLEAFRHRHHLSVGDLAGICSSEGTFISKSAMSRLLRGEMQPRFVNEIRGGALAALRHYLSSIKRLKPVEIEAELRSIFVQQEVEAVITERSELPREAYEFFGLKRDPFDPRDPRNRKEEFTTPALDKIAQKAEDAIRYQGFLGIIGGIGSGKTTLKRRIGEIVNDSNGKLVLLWPEFFNMDKVHSGSIVYYLLHHFQERAPQDLISRAAALKKLLANLAEQGIHVALGFDECHRLDKRLIIALKNFWELGSGGYDRYLGVLLFGQPSFEFILGEHCEIQERVNIVRMPGLGKNASTYLSHRIQIAGGRLERLFEPAAISRIVKWTDTPLAIGNVANAALLKAFKMREKQVKAAFVPEKNGDPQIRGIRSA